MKVEITTSIWNGKDFEKRSVVMEVYDVDILYNSDVHLFHSDVADFAISVNEYHEIEFDFRFNRVSLEIMEID